MSKAGRQRAPDLPCSGAKVHSRAGTADRTGGRRGHAIERNGAVKMVCDAVLTVLEGKPPISASDESMHHSRLLEGGCLDGWVGWFGSG